MSKKSSDTLIMPKNWELISLEPVNPMDELPFGMWGQGPSLQTISYKRHEAYLKE